MIKRRELADPNSCLNRAYSVELLFVLLARDIAAPKAIRAWIEERVRLGKNEPTDDQIKEAARCADMMECQREGFEIRRPFEPRRPDNAYRDLKTAIRTHKFTRDPEALPDFPPCVLPSEICDQIDAIIDAAQEPNP